VLPAKIGIGLVGDDALQECFLSFAWPMGGPLEGPQVTAHWQASESAE
jgi:hypothetical protein